MFTIFKDFPFSAAHSIRGHTRGCQNLHGHNYRVRVHLTAERLDGLGMVLDFADLKAIMAEVIGPFDHRVLNEIPPFDVRNTTAELIAQYVCEEVSRRLAAGAGAEGRGVRVAQVDVWETDTSCAIFTPDLGVLGAAEREPGRD